MNVDIETLKDYLVSPDVITGAVIMMLVLVVVSILLRGGRSRQGNSAKAGSFRHQQVSSKSYGDVGEPEDFKRGKGVSFLKPRKDDNLYIDAISESLMSDQGMSTPEGGEVDEECRVDAITEAEVYLTYNRPEQALQVLQEGYARGDGNQVLIALKLLDVFELMRTATGSEGEMLKFIDRLFADRAQYSGEEWAQLTEKIMQVKEDVLPPMEVKKKTGDESAEEGTVALEYDEEGNLVYKEN
jgi:hypothetical protein